MQFPSELVGYNIKLSTFTNEDMERLFKWRNLPEIRSKMADNKQLIWQSHTKWFHALASLPKEKHFIIKYKDKAIGTINIRILEKNTGEIGLYIGEERYRSNIIAFAPSLLLTDYAFKILNIETLKSQVRQENIAAIKYNQQLGYQIDDSNKCFITITLNKKDYFDKTQLLKSLLTRTSRVSTE